MDAIRLPSRADYAKAWRTILRSSGIGTFIGILPAEGATVASMIGYNEAKRWSKTPEEFGNGAIEGIAGSEAANNSATGGAMVPLRCNSVLFSFHHRPMSSILRNTAPRAFSIALKPWSASRASAGG